MGTQTTTQQVFRQRSPLALSVLFGVTGLLLLVSMALDWADKPEPLFALWVIFGLALMWSLFVRPAVLLDIDGVTIRNVLRDIHIPWVLVTDVEFRWNLKVFTGDRAYTAWAISSQVERPKGTGGGRFAILPGQVNKYARADVLSSTPAPKVTASMVARSIEAAKEDYAEAVAHGALAAPPESQVRISVVPLVLVVLVLPAVAIVALSLI